MDISSDLDPLW